MKHGEADPEKLSCGERDKNTILLRRKRFHAYGEKGESRAFSLLAEKGAAQRNGGGSSRILVPDGLREVEDANDVRHGTAARFKYKPNHGYTVFSTTTHPPVIIAVLPEFAEFISCTHRHIHFEYWASAFCMQVK